MHGNVWGIKFGADRGERWIGGGDDFSSMRVPRGDRGHAPEFDRPPDTTGEGNACLNGIGR